MEIKKATQISYEISDFVRMRTFCGTQGDRLRMCIPNQCVRKQYYEFLRD